MGNKTKIGKQRKDKFYRLAKETGFRSRAAFKLIQLNRKFEFLQKSRVCVDLCAAPGGWMQVAKQAMPVSSIVVGVDLFPIKPVPGCIGLQEDITTDKCRVAIQQALQTWKADVFLNDGAPNIGKNWLHDAFQQTCLTLSALKLATHFLRPGGWFVTKIFRSKDYNPLLWVLKQLFKKVHSTKPQASRNESAEIFVVCQHYLAPDKLDGRFLDPKHVFEELQLDPSTRLNVFHPDRAKKAKAEGYAEGDYSLRYVMPVSEFLTSEDAVSALQKATEILIDDKDVANNPLTTLEVKECCKDIRVLGRKDLRKLLTWWKELREEKKKNTEELNEDNIDTTEVDLQVDEDDDDALDLKLAHLEKEDALEARRKRKQANKTRHKLQTQLDLKMVLKGDEGPALQDQDLFELSDIHGKKALRKVVEQVPDVVAESDPDSDVELPPRVVRYSKDGPQHLHSSGTHYTDEESDLEEEGEDSEDKDFSKEGLGLDDDEESESNEGEETQTVKPQPANPLVTDLDYRKKEEKRLQRASLWFQKDIFKEVELDEDADMELEEIENKLQGVGKRKREEKFGDERESSEISQVVNNRNEDDSDYDWDEAKDLGKEMKRKKNVSGKESDNNDDQNWEKEENDKEKKKKKNQQKTKLNNVAKDGFEVVPAGPKRIKLNAEGLALGAVMVSSRKAKRDIIDAGWNRYAFNDDGLPEWFTHDEEKHMRKKLPVPPRLVGEYKKREEELNVRPIKKIVEAKARKKKRAVRRLEKAKKKVEAVMENVDISEREKARQVKQLYKKAKGGKKPEVTYIVAKKHTAGKRMRRPPGVKGPYKVVDPRMKKDDRKRKLGAKGKIKTKGPKVPPSHGKAKGKRK